MSEIYVTYMKERVRSALIPSKRSFRALSCRCLRAGLESTNRFCRIMRLGMGRTTASAIVGYCEETDPAIHVVHRFLVKDPKEPERTYTQILSTASGEAPRVRNHATPV